MPKVSLSSEKDVGQFVGVWANDTRKGQYVVFYSRMDKMMVLVPSTSTDPLIYGWRSGVSEPEAEKVAGRYNLPFVPCGHWDWSADHIRQGE